MLALALTLALFAQPLGPHATDLVVEARVTTPRAKVGEPLPLVMALVNHGKRPLPVVKPGDGSESNWREPYVWFSAERQDAGVWVPVPKGEMGRCGLFDGDWEKDTVTLVPGGRLPLKEWVDHPEWSLQLDKPGHYRMTVHYTFGTSTRSGVVDRKGAMKGVASFEVTSAPFELELTR